ncbi:MAG: hypothetical protein L6R40_003284 [Gallowayella cf. fulva]|nr:MAG: hypothetical protein L6R40_003284 [Xanthomendoza cf. fulva]
MASQADYPPGTQQPVCQNCSTSTTPLWRRDEYGSVLCNACGLFLKLHGSPRPISLKTDVIKSRNRVRTAIPGQKRKVGRPAAAHYLRAQADESFMQLPHDPNDPSDNAAPSASHPQLRRTSAAPSDPSRSPVSRTVTPAGQQTSNIAPQHLFDGATLNDHTFHASPPLPSFHIRQPSPGSTSSQNDRRQDSKPSYEQLHQENTVLKTRVSELEVINILYKGQVGEQDQKATESDQQLRHLLEEAQRRENDLKQQVKELEQEIADLRGGEPALKHQRLSDGSEYPDPSDHGTTDTIPTS